MTVITLYAVLTLTLIGAVSAVVLYVMAQKFKVEEDPLIEKVEKILPGVNCGACGFAGCRNFAEAATKATDLSAFYCPVGGNEVMGQLAAALGHQAFTKDPMIAVVRCAGSFEHRSRTNVYDSAKTCLISTLTYSGETGCAYGCLGFGDCVRSCRFDAIVMDPRTGLPLVDQAKCTACGACVAACPLKIIELRKKGKKDLRIFVSCVNKDKGAVARKACSVACIACGRCVKECPSQAISMDNNLAYIDFRKCTLCRKCVAVCPTHAIQEVNFPARKDPKASTVGPMAQDKGPADSHVRETL